jgi:hypothetical protein
MSKRKKDIDETLYALKYPDYHTWRDLDAALKRGGFWPSGQPVRLSDPEMKPKMDELMEKIKSDPEFARQMLKDLNLPPTYVA